MSAAKEPQAVPQGYKQTEVGVIPEDWEASRIDAHTSIKTGSRNTQDRVDDGAYPFFVRSQIVERINSYSYDGEAVLTAGDGVGTGKVFHYVNGRFDVHQRVYRITEFDGQLSGKYFFYQFSTRFYDRIMAMTAKSSVDSVRMEMIAGMQIPLPPTLAEQEAIAEALSDADALIDSLEQLIAKKRRVKQGAMQDLLTCLPTGRPAKRLPGFEGEWEVKTLGEVAETDPENLGSDTRPDYEFNYIALEDVDEGRLSGSTTIRFSDAPSRARRKLRQADVLVSTVRPNLRSHLQFSESNGTWVCSTGFCVVRCKEGITHPAFVFNLMFSDVVNRQIDALLTGSNYPAINSGDVRRLEIPCPSHPEQTAIAAILSDMDAEIAALEAKLAKARQVKQGMMQELLTGKTRLV